MESEGIFNDVKVPYIKLSDVISGYTIDPLFQPIIGALNGD